MSRWFSILALAALASCGSSIAPPAATGAFAPAPLEGGYLAASETARSLTGDVSIERGGLIFSRGIVLYTRSLNPRRGGDLVSTHGDSYAAIAVGPSDLEVELRRVIEQVAPDGSAGLCGEAAPTYVAIAHDGHGAQATLLVFAGDEVPGPDAVDTRLCGAFAYVAPDGARTREGVLLW